MTPFDAAANVDVLHFLSNVLTHASSVDQNFLDSLNFVANHLHVADYSGVWRLEREANYAHELSSLFLRVPANYGYDRVVDFLAEVDANEIPASWWVHVLCPVVGDWGEVAGNTLGDEFLGEVGELVFNELS